VPPRAFPVGVGEKIVESECEGHNSFLSEKNQQRAGRREQLGY